MFLWVEHLSTGKKLLVNYKMSTRLGMADGRCATINVSGTLLNEGIMTKIFNLKDFDSYGYRMKLQSSDPSDVIPGPTCSLKIDNKDEKSVQINEL
jgi:hypothetical protein